jgi:hypothetical protein
MTSRSVPLYEYGNHERTCSFQYVCANTHTHTSTSSIRANVHMTLSLLSISLTNIYESTSSLFVCAARHLHTHTRLLSDYFDECCYCLTFFMCAAIHTNIHKHAHLFMNFFVCIVSNITGPPTSLTMISLPVRASKASNTRVAGHFPPGFRGSRDLSQRMLSTSESATYCSFSSPVRYTVCVRTYLSVLLHMDMLFCAFIHRLRVCSCVLFTYSRVIYALTSREWITILCIGSKLLRQNPRITHKKSLSMTRKAPGLCTTVYERNMFDLRGAPIAHPALFASWENTILRALCVETMMCIMKT